MTACLMCKYVRKLRHAKGGFEEFVTRNFAVCKSCDKGERGIEKVDFLRDVIYT